MGKSNQLFIYPLMTALFFSLSSIGVTNPATSSNTTATELNAQVEPLPKAQENNQTLYTIIILILGLVIIIVIVIAIVIVPIILKHQLLTTIQPTNREIEKHSELIAQLSEKIEKLSDKLEKFKISTQSAPYQPESNNHSNEEEINQQQEEEEEVDKSPSQPQLTEADLIDFYQQDPESLEQLGLPYCEVSETELSFDERINNNNSRDVILATPWQTGIGEYWIISLLIEEETYYYLFPKKPIVSSQEFTAKALFDGFQGGVSGKFILRKPAKVSCIGDNNNNDNSWKLEKKGLLKFLS